jgi:cytochrome c-type biogenesis protein CcmF
MVGTIIVWIAAAAAAFSAYGYYVSVRGQKRFLAMARNSYGIMAMSVIAASVALMVYILRHQFEYAYVWGYSSRELPLSLLITTFWAGQEGSFLFWAFCSSLIGLVLISYSRKRGIEAETMTVYAIVLLFLLVLLLVKSPFEYLWQAQPENVPVGMIPENGRGLNPLLQNFWMIAHPPVLFVGFAAMAVPFVFAISALWRRAYAQWIENALPWVIAGTIALGTGIMLGGYWAYGVLGWGGWWGWDPVENSSLIPWIVGIILLHTMLVQRRTGGLVKTNLFLGISTYVLVVYSTFLTRSGILGSASVHSFVDPGAIAYTLLIIWVGASVLVGFGMIFRRWSDLKTSSTRSPLMTRESILGISSAVMGASALVILFGTSWPIISHASLEPAFYDKTNLPIAIAMGLLLGLSLLVQWKEESSSQILKNAAASLIAAAATSVVLVLAGLDNIVMGMFAFASLFAFFVNAIRLYRLAKENLRFTGGAISHIGLALLFLGIIASGYYGQKQTASLPMNEAKDVLGYKLTFLGGKPTEDGKWIFTVNVEKDGSQFSLDPVMFESTYDKNLMRNPDYATFLTRDFYVEPVSLEEGGPVQSPSGEILVLKKGEPKTVKDVTITFQGFDMNHGGTQAMARGGEVTIGAVLSVKRGKTTEQVTAITVYDSTVTPRPKTATTKDGKLAFALLGMNVDTPAKGSTIQLAVQGVSDQPPVQVEKPQLLVIEASVKPFMSLIWTGAFLMMFGLAVSVSTKLKRSNQMNA